MGGCGELATDHGGQGDREAEVLLGSEVFVRDQGAEQGGDQRREKSQEGGVSDGLCKPYREER